MKAPTAFRGLMKRGAAVEQLPYPDPFSRPEIAIIERALHYACVSLANSDEIDAKVAAEVEMTSNLEAFLNRMLHSEVPEVPGFTLAIFQSVIRGGELVNHNGTMPEKRPDLAFRSQRSLPDLCHPHQCALLVECKIVDKKHPMRLYCREGLLRFVDGTYSWAVRSSIMLGYARDGYSPDKQLRKHLDKYGDAYSLRSNLTEREPGQHPKWYVTVHDRDLSCLLGSSAPEISVHHLWVTVA